MVASEFALAIGVRVADADDACATPQRFYPGEVPCADDVPAADDAQPYHLAASSRKRSTMDGHA
jgi:hypothetical protein